jgi:hypothetical protein
MSEDNYVHTGYGVFERKDMDIERIKQQIGDELCGCGNSDKICTTRALVSKAIELYIKTTSGDNC